MFYIQFINIKNYKDQIKNIVIESLPKNTPFIFLTGENGIGKTLFLQSLAFALHPIDNAINYIVNSEERFVLEVFIHDVDIFGVVAGGNKQSMFYRNSNFKFLRCYGATRLETYSESSNELFGSDSGIENLLNYRSLLINIEYDLLRWGLKMNSKILTPEEQEKFRQKLESAKDIILDVLDICEIKLDYSKDRVLYIEKDDEGNPLPPVTKDQLATGYQSLLGLIGDLISGYFKMHPDFTKPEQFVGIVLIDELELHLHPKWQKKLPQKLHKYFPKLQFVVSTHSAIPLLGAPPKSVILKVNRSKKEGITVDRLTKIEKELNYLLPNAILTSDIFELDDISPSSNEDIDKLSFSNTYSEFEEMKIIRDRLSDYEGDEMPDSLFEED